MLLPSTFYDGGKLGHEAIFGVAGGFGASAAAPIVRDSMTYLFDKQKAFAALAPLEEQWGGTLAERNARQLAAFKSASLAAGA